MPEATPDDSSSPQSSQERPARRRGRRFWRALLAGFALFGLLGYFAGPPLLKSVLLRQLSAQLHREVAIERVEINPYTLSARISGLTVRAEDGHEVAGFDELQVNVSTASLYQRAVVIDELRLLGPRLAVARLEDNRYDVSDLIDAWMAPKATPDTGVPRFSLNNLQIRGGRLDFDDRPAGRQHAVREIELAVPFISSLPYQTDIKVEPAFSARIDGARLALAGSSQPFSSRRESELRLELAQFDLAAVQPYLPRALPVRLAQGRLGAALRINFAAPEGEAPRVTLSGTLRATDLALNEAAGGPLLGWQQLEVDLGEVDPLRRQVDVRRVALDGFALDLAVDRKGELNLLRLARGLMPAGTPATAPAETAPPLGWRLGEFSLTDARLRWRDDSGRVPVAGEIRDLRLALAGIDSRLDAPLVLPEIAFALDLGERFRLGQLQLHDTRIDLAAHRVEVGEVAGTKPVIRLLRDAEGKLQWLTAPVLASRSASPTRKAAAPREAAWTVDVARLGIDDLALRLEDRSVRPVAVQEIDGLSLRGEHLGNGAGRKGRLEVQARVNRKGVLRLAGEVQAVPLAATVQLETTGLPVLPLQPYFSEFVNIALTRGQVSNRGEISLRQERSGLKAAYTGSLTVGNLVAVDKANSADFLKWKSLYLGHLDVRLDPMAIQVGEIALTDFYSRLILDAGGRLNVQDIVRSPETTPAPAAPLATPAAVSTQPALPIRIDRITLQNGTVNFSDFFVKPNYSVNLTHLGGRVTGLSSADDTVADLELRGSYADSAPVNIVARLNPLAARAFLDLKAQVNGVDLVGFSPYSGKYAGYNIEKGKLSLNVAYKLEDRRLSADNTLFIDQFTFGEAVDSADATKLPVNLAIALLKNSRGEIDINLPVAGSLDDPEFSLGGLVVKVIVNLFVKAVTSPFALLGSMFGSGEELSNVGFVPGRAALDAAGQGKLETLARAMLERPALKLEISGRADPEKDREGLRREALNRAVRAEKLKEMLKKGEEGNSLDTLDIAPEAYPGYLERAYRAARFPKPRNAIGLLKDLPVEEMEKLMLTNLPASDEDVRQLARQRAEYVQSWLIDKGKVPLERLFLVPPRAEGGEQAASRVEFSLR